MLIAEGTYTTLLENVDYRVFIDRDYHDTRGDREERARQHIAGLEPRLVHVQLRPSDALRSTPGFQVKLDGTVVPVGEASKWPADPGLHEVVVWAPGKRRWVAQFAVQEGTDLKLSLPALRDAPRTVDSRAQAGPLSASRRSAELDPSSSSASRTAGWVLGASGVASLGVAGYFGWRAAKKQDEAQTLCSASPCSDMRGVQSNEDAQWAATRANAFAALGVLALGAGVTLWLTSEGSDTPAVALSAASWRSGAQLSASAAF